MDEGQLLITQLQRKGFTFREACYIVQSLRHALTCPGFIKECGEYGVEGIDKLLNPHKAKCLTCYDKGTVMTLKHEIAPCPDCGGGK